MATPQTTRRNFLGTLATLSAGAAFASATGSIAVHGPTHLEQQWDVFCRRNKGELYYHKIQPENGCEIIACPGHTHQTGRAVFFKNENILAEPTWIFWGTQRAKPADVVITFYNKERERKKICTLNRFELEGLNLLSPEIQENTILLIHQKAYSGPPVENAAKLHIKAWVKSDQHVHLSVTHIQKNIHTSKQYFYTS